MGSPGLEKGANEKWRRDDRRPTVPPVLRIGATKQRFLSERIEAKPEDLIVFVFPARESEIGPRGGVMDEKALLLMWTKSAVERPPKI